MRLDSHGWILFRAVVSFTDKLVQVKSIRVSV